MPLHRSDFADGDRPAVISGTSHDLIAEAIRAESGADIGHLRGFRYGTHVAPGPITLEDLFHYLPVGAHVARHLAGRRVMDVPPAIELSPPLPPPRTATPRSSRSAAGRDTPHTSAVPRPCTARYDALR